MKLARFAGMLSLSLLAGGCNMMGGEDAIPEDNPAPAATPSPSPATDTAAVTIDSTGNQYDDAQLTSF